MRDAFGGVFTLQLVVIFMIIVNCFLAFSVNYTKAFRAKNEVRSIIEKYEGLTCCAMKQIETVLAKDKYQLPKNYSCPKGYTLAIDSGSTARFCVKVQKVDVDGGTDIHNKYKGAYYSVVTYVNINIPIFDRIFASTDLQQAFAVKGETALIYSSGENHSGTMNFGGCECNKSSK